MRGCRWTTELLKVVPFDWSREMGVGKSTGPHHEGPCKLYDKLGASSLKPQEAIKEFNPGADEIRFCATAGLEDRQEQ